MGDKEKFEQFVTEILNCGFSKALALKALKEVNVEDVAEGKSEVNIIFVVVTGDVCECEFLKL